MRSLLHRVVKLLGLSSLLLALAACNTETVKTTTLTPTVIETAKIPEAELLDVGVGIFEPGLDDIPSNRKELTFGDVRMAETQFVSYQLAQTLQGTGNWGVVRVNPNDLSYTDVAVHGTIIQSDGETMRVKVKVSDVSGKLWFDKEYKETVSKYSYDSRNNRNDDPFQGLYNRIANDILAYRQKNLKSADLLNLRTLSKLQFARRFAPQVFDSYVDKDRQGLLTVKRLPANDDPLLVRLDAIRERDYAFVDALQDHYTNFAGRMRGPYTDFRRKSYDEVMKYDQLHEASTRNMVLGIAAIVGGLAATQGSSNASTAAVYGGLLGGGYLVKDAFSKRDEAQMQVESLAELGNSIGGAIAPHTIELGEKVVTLTGTVDEQYGKWKQMLADLYANETGAAPAAPPAATK
ncbi:MAG TPA: hypothetical protein VMH83_07175 [Candidatus Acidoferrum sp.]|nr:hypothetical protein [Candidatus Acidoferrum sp.]